MLTKTKHVLVFVVVAVAIIITNSGLPKRFTELPGEDEVVTFKVSWSGIKPDNIIWDGITRNNIVEPVPGKPTDIWGPHLEPYQKGVRYHIIVHVHFYNGEKFAHYYTCSLYHNNEQVAYNSKNDFSVLECEWPKL